MNGRAWTAGHSAALRDLVALGLFDRAIADRLGFSRKTILQHRRALGIKRARVEVLRRPFWRQAAAVGVAISMLLA